MWHTVAQGFSNYSRDQTIVFQEKAAVRYQHIIKTKQKKTKQNSL